MAKITIYGHSDDLIEIDGDLSEEFYSEPQIFGDYGDGREKVDLLVFSDGSVVKVEYDYNGVWRLNMLHWGTAKVSLDLAPPDDDNNYSDRLTLDGDLTWVVHGTNKTVAC